MAKYVLGDIFQGNFGITQYYGQNPQTYAQYGLAGHEGIDFGTPTGTPILAPFDGKIIRDNDDFKNNNYGDFIVVWDPMQKCAGWFCHLNDNNVTVGDTVKQGQVLGHTDNSGNSTGPHLHFNFVETDESGNRLNMNNGYQGFLNALDPNLVAWKLGGLQQTVPQAIPTTGSLPANFSDMVHGSSQWDNTCSDQSLGDPTKTDYAMLKSVIGGYKSRITDLGNQLTTSQTEQGNISEQVSRLKQQVLDGQGREDSLTEQLKKSGQQVADAVGVLQGQMKNQQQVIDGLAKDKGSLNQQIATLQNQLADAKKAMTKTLSLTDILSLLVERLTGKEVKF